MDVNFGSQEQVLWPASVLAGIAMCAAVYDLTREFSSRCFKCYNGLNDIHKLEWNSRCLIGNMYANNVFYYRGFSTIHALLAAAVSFYLVAVSDLCSTNDVQTSAIVMVDRKSWLSDAMLGVSLGYFLTDLAMILWHFPALGGKEYILHHALSMYAIALALLSGKGHVYILMVLNTEATTPFVNLRWYLDLAGRKGSDLYLYNGLALFVGWLVARIILFVYFFAHLYLHFHQVRTVFPVGLYSIAVVPPVFAAMNLLWFRKICKGMAKALSNSNSNSKTKRA